MAEALSDEFGGLLEAVKKCLKKSPVPPNYRVEAFPGVPELPGKAIDIKITIPHPLENGDIWMGELDEFNELKRCFANTLDSLGYILRYMLISDEREGCVLYLFTASKTRLGEYFSALDDIKADIKMGKGEMKPSDAVKFLIIKFGISFSAANTAVYKYRKERGLIK
jgi:hypothetical protein